VTLLGTANAFNAFNNAGTIDIVVDLTGSFFINPATSSSSSAAAQGQTPGQGGYHTSGCCPLGDDNDVGRQRFA
jgi:hypothetical protein